MIFKKKDNSTKSNPTKSNPTNSDSMNKSLHNPNVFHSKFNANDQDFEEYDEVAEKIYALDDRDYEKNFSSKGLWQRVVAVRISMPKIRNEYDRRAFLALSLGVISVFSMPPFGMVWVLPFSFGILIYSLWHVVSAKKAFAFVFAYSFGFFSFSSFWLTSAFFKVPYGILLAPICFGLLICGLSALYGLVGFITVHIKNKIIKSYDVLSYVGFASYLLIFASLWTLAEIIRSISNVGFSYNPLSLAWYKYPSILQSLSFLGEFGLTFITILITGLIFMLFLWHKKRRIFVIVSLGILLYILIGIGQQRLFHAKRLAHISGVKVRMIQANVSEKDKWNYKTAPQMVKRSLILSSGKIPNETGLPANELKSDHLNLHTLKEFQDLKDIPTDPNLILWAEGGLVYDIRSERLRKYISKYAPKDSISLVGSVAHLKIDPKSKSEDKDNIKYRNSIFAIDNNSQIITRSDKYGLVPFGEYTPFINSLGMRLPFVGKEMEQPKNKPKAVDLYSMAQGNPLIKDHDIIKKIPSYFPLICYESTLPNFVNRLDDPQWIFVTTNDQWFSSPVSLNQHVELSRFRAIEQGLGVVQVGNTGVSAIINPYGEYWYKGEVNRMDFMDAPIPKALAKTIYSKFGLKIPITLIFIAFVVGVISLKLEVNQALARVRRNTERINAKIAEMQGTSDSLGRNPKERANKSRNPKGNRAKRRTYKGNRPKNRRK